MALAAWQATIVDESGNIQSLASVEVLLESSGATAALFSDRDGANPIGSNPTTADENGFVRFYAAGGSYRINATLGAFTRTWRHVPIGLLGERDALESTLVKYDRIAAEVAASVTPSDYAKTPHYYDVRRAGIVPNEPTAATTNATALIALLNPDTVGITGTVIFPNTTGEDIYYIGDIIEIRDRITLDLCGSTLHFSKTYESSDNTMGFLTFIRNVTIKNGRIEVDYDGSAGTNAGLAMRIGSRSSYPFGAATGGLFDSLLSAPMGNIKLQDLEITTNNP